LLDQSVNILSALSIVFLFGIVKKSPSSRPTTPTSEREASPNIEAAEDLHRLAASPRKRAGFLELSAGLLADLHIA
jgi:hypothetical protein